MKCYFFNGYTDFFLGAIDFKKAEKEMGAICIMKRYSDIPRILAPINKFHTSLQINKKVNLPLKSIWSKYDMLNQVEDGSILIITDSSAEKLTYRDLVKLSGRNVNIYLLFLNSAETTAGSYALALCKDFPFAYVFSIDKADCDKYGFEYTNQVYFKSKIARNEEKNQGLFFVGNNKGRLEILRKINDSYGKCNFYVSGVQKKEKGIENNIIYNTYLDYPTVIHKLNTCNCILEILQKKQNGLTFRFYEAICYNKKLLTNNSLVKELPEYDPRFIQVFDNVEDIDYDFVDRCCEVDYHYNDRYSPKYFVERVRTIDKKIREDNQSILKK